MADPRPQDKVRKELNPLRLAGHHRDPWGTVLTGHGPGKMSPRNPASRPCLWGSGCHRGSCGRTGAGAAFQDPKDHPVQARSPQSAPSLSAAAATFTGAEARVRGSWGRRRVEEQTHGPSLPHHPHFGGQRPLRCACEPGHLVQPPPPPPALPRTPRLRPLTAPPPTARQRLPGGRVRRKPRGQSRPRRGLQKPLSPPDHPEPCRGLQWGHRARAPGLRTLPKARPPAG